MFKRFLTYSILSLIALGGFFGNVDITNNLENHITFSIKSNTTYALGEFNAAKDSQAANVAMEAEKSTPSSTDATKMYNGLIDGMNIILGVITVIVSPAIMFAGWLMSPDWTSGDLFGLRAPMYALWVTISNIVYFIYAILLILIALGTMFGQDKFSYKVMLPKLALGILMVPFTWWFVQWTISIATVVTASVITIPAETMSSNTTTNSTWWTTPSIPNQIIINETASDSLKKEGTSCSSGNCKSPQDFLTKSSGMYGYMMVYAYSIFKFDQVKELHGVTDILKEGISIVHQGIIAAIMFIVFGLLTMALVSMLLVRAIKLWMYAIFAPLFTFRFVAGSNLLGGDDDSFSIKEFIGLAFVPAIVGLTLSFGLIMINAVSSGKVSGATATVSCTPELIKGAGCTIANIMGNSENTIIRKIRDADDKEKATTLNIIKFGGIEIQFEGKAGPAQEEVDKSNSSVGVLNSAGGIFGTLIIDIIALVFIWMSFMAAKNVSKAVKMAVQPFEDIGNKIGGLAKSMPKYMPIPGLGVSASGIGKVIEKKEQGMVSDRQNRDANSALGKWAGLEGAQRAGTRNALNDYTSNQITQASTKNVLVQISQESEGNQIKGATEMLNSAIKRFTKTDDKGKVEITDPTKFKEAIKWMNLDEINDYGKIKDHIEKNNGNISENFLRENANGKDMLKKMVGNKTPPNNEKPSTGAKDENKPGGEKPPATPSSTPSPKH